MKVRVLFVAAMVASCSRSEARTPDPADATASIATPSSTTTSRVAASAKGFGAACVADDECVDHVCFHKRLKTADAGRERRGADGEAVEHDGYCSIRCRDDADCPVPPTRGRCGARGMCKRPE